MYDWNKIVELAAERFQVPAEQIQKTTSIKELGDSLELVQFGMDLESEYDILIPDAAYQALKTVGDVFDFLEGVK